MDPCLLWLLATDLVHQDQSLHVPLQFSCHIKPFHYHVCPYFQKFCARGHIFIWDLDIRHDIRVHLDDPLNQFHIIDVQSGTEFLIFVNKLLFQKLAQIWWITFRWLLERTLLHQEVTWIDAEIIIQNDNRTLLLQYPYLLVQFGILVGEEFPIERVIDQQCHEGTWSCLICWVGEFTIDLGDLELDVFKVFLFERFVLKYEFLTCFFLDHFVESIEIIIIELSRQDISIYLLNKLH